MRYTEPHFFSFRNLFGAAFVFDSEPLELLPGITFVMVNI